MGTTTVKRLIKAILQKPFLAKQPAIHVPPISSDKTFKFKPALPTDTAKQTNPFAKPVQQPVEPPAQTPTKPTVVTKKGFVILHLVAKTDHVFSGYELLQAFSLYGLKHGHMNIFHKMQEDDPSRVLFSLAQATEPGSFDLSDIGGIVCAGLTCFCDLTKQPDPEAAFDYMLTILVQLAEELNATLLDAEKAVFTQATYLATKAQLAAFEPACPA